MQFGLAHFATDLGIAPHRAARLGTAVAGRLGYLRDLGASEVIFAWSWDSLEEARRGPEDIAWLMERYR